MTKFGTLAALCCAAALSGCDKTAVQDISAPAPGAAIRFFNFGVGAPGVNFYGNERKLTAITSATGTESTTGVGYGSVAAGGFYTGVEPGQYTFSGKIAAATDKDLAISSVPVTIEAGKFYSFYQSGFYSTTAKNVDAFVVEDPLPPTVDFANAYVRFVNAISNSSPMTLFVKATTPATSAEVTVGGLVAYKNASVFVSIPPGVYDLATRTSGSSTNAITRASSSSSTISFLAGHMYTISARGDMTITSTTATNRPFLDNTANR